MHNIIVYGFPLLLVAFEHTLRTIVGVDTSVFIGPTFAATSISFIVPLTKLKQKTIISNEGEGLKVSTKKSVEFTYIMWIILFISLFLWFWVCSLSLQSQTSEKPEAEIPLNLIISIIMYIVSVIMCALKEVIK